MSTITVVVISSLIGIALIAVSYMCGRVHGARKWKDIVHALMQRELEENISSDGAYNELLQNVYESTRGRNYDSDEFMELDTNGDSFWDEVALIGNHTGKEVSIDHRIQLEREGLS